MRQAGASDLVIVSWTGSRARIWTQSTGTGQPPATVSPEGTIAPSSQTEVLMVWSGGSSLSRHDDQVLRQCKLGPVDQNNAVN